MNKPKVWLVTGANSGFGRAIAEDAIAAGDIVVAAVRRPEAVADLLAAYPDQVDPVRLDVTDTARIDDVVADVLARHGRVDVLVNNAGRTQVGAVEETTDEELRYLFDLHFFGPAALIRAVLPAMRAQRSGAIVNLSSVGGQASFGGFSAYSATKFALEGLSEALADEMREFGVKVLVVEPGAFRTNLFGAGAAYFSAENPAYAGSAGKTREFVRTGHGGQAGDPAKAAAAIRTALAADHTPLRLPLGDDSVDTILAHLDTVRAEIADWEKVARNTKFDD